MRFYKYQGAGNDFLVADNRSGAYDSLTPSVIAELCDRRYGFGADGLMLLEESRAADFKMVFYNPDGSGGMMCGNGGRCMVAFAAWLGYTSFAFEAADGLHTAEIVEHNEALTRMTVRLKMTDVVHWEALSDGDWYLDTGTRHRVRFVAGDLAEVAVDQEGRALRHDPYFAPVGTNVNFVDVVDAEHLRVRTFEKGVEAETYACGTGIVASCVASVLSGRVPYPALGSDPRVALQVQALRDALSVDFEPLPQDLRQAAGCCAREIWLTGPAVQVGEVIATNLPVPVNGRSFHPGI